MKNTVISIASIISSTSVSSFTGFAVAGHYNFTINEWDHGTRWVEIDRSASGYTEVRQFTNFGEEYANCFAKYMDPAEFGDMIDEFAEQQLRLEENILGENWVVIDTETWAMDLTKPFTTQVAADVSAVKFNTYSGRIEKFSMLIDGPMPEYSQNLNPGYYENMKRYSAEDVRFALRQFIGDATLITAYNCGFDAVALNNAGVDSFTFSFDLKERYTEAVIERPEYKAWCEKRGLTPNLQHGRKSGLSAQAAYRFIKSDDAFVEKHTGLDDALIELEILKFVMGI